MKLTDPWRVIYSRFLILREQNRMMSICKRLVSETLGSRPTMPKSLPGHWHTITNLQRYKIHTTIKQNIIINRFRTLNIIIGVSLAPTITLFRFITMLYGSDNILQIIPSFRLHVRNILQNVVSPT